MARTLFIIFSGLLLFPVLVNGQKKSYQFDGSGISAEVLENYLERAVTMVYLLVPENPEGGGLIRIMLTIYACLKTLGPNSSAGAFTVGRRKTFKQSAILG